MFTGLIEEIGTIAQISQSQEGLVLAVSCREILKQLNIGDSVAVNGVCLTARKITSSCFYADVMPVTLRRSNLKALQIKSQVNLERAISAGDRFGGHMVSGHIDGMGRVDRVSKEGNAVKVQITVPEALAKYIIEKGSVAIDGISLTVAAVSGQALMVSIIPHTGQNTTLTQKRTGDLVNIECDLVGKYTMKYVELQGGDPKSKGIDTGFLREHGFL